MKSKLTVQDMHSIAAFHKVFKNYIKIVKLLNEQSLSYQRSTSKGASIPA